MVKHVGAETQCVLDAGDANAGRLLFKLRGLFRHPEKLAAHDSERWFVSTRDEWIERLGGPQFFSRHQYNRALAILKKKCLIVIRHAPHPYRRGVLRATWMRPQLPPKADNQLPPKADQHWSAATDNWLSGGTDNPISKETESKTESKTDSYAKATPMASESMENEMMKEIQKVKPLKSLKDFVAPKPIVLEELKHNATHMQLAMGWQAAAGVPGWSNNKSWCVVHFKKRAMKVGGHPAETMAMVIKYWVLFASQTSKAEGVVFPHEPSIKFLMEHAERAVKFTKDMQQSLKKAIALQTAQPVTFAPAPKYVPEPKPTKEEVLAILNAP